VSLRHFPYVGQWIGWLVPGGFSVTPAPLAAIPQSPAANDEGPVSPEAIRRRLMETIQGPSRPVVVAPLDSCTPVDVGRIEDLIFPDPQTADRIIRAAGQGFRVVVLTPVADPNPSLESQDCPRPLVAASPAIASDAAHPQPTPVLGDPEGRVQMTSTPGSLVQNRSPKPVYTFGRHFPSPGEFFGFKEGRRPGLLVPHPAPSPDAGYPIAISAEPKRVHSELTPAAHLRLAAGQLAKQGFEDEAERLRTKAAELDQHIAERLKTIRRQQHELQAEHQRLVALAGEPRQLEIRAQILRIEREPFTTRKGIALVRKHLGEKFSDMSPIWPQVVEAALSDEFRREAGTAGYLNILSRPTLMTMVGQEAQLQIGSEVPITNPQDRTTRMRAVGIRLTLVPARLEGDRLELRANPEVTGLRQTGIRLADQDVAGIQAQSLQTSLSLTLGQTAVIGGFRAPRFLTDEPAIRQASGEDDEANESPDSELLFLLTPVAPSNSSADVEANRPSAKR